MSSKTEDGQHLFEEFPPVSRQEWEKVIAKDLKGGDYKQKLRWNTGEGIDALPFYRRDDLDRPEHTTLVSSLKNRKNEWSMRQPVFASKVDKANSNAITAIEGGAEALQFKMRIHQTEGMLGGDLEGTAIQDQQDFETLLDGIDPGKIPIHFDCGTAAPLLLAMLHNDVERRGMDPGTVFATLLFDPYAYTATSGHLPKPENDFLDEAAQMVRFGNNRFGGIRTLGVDARTYHNAGATIIQELALALATGSEYLAGMAERDLSVPGTAANIHFSFSIGPYYFLEIAKFRAARLLWEKIVGAYQSGDRSPDPAYIHGETSGWNTTIYDPYTNMLRTTTEGMSAVIAGCDSLTVYPFDSAFRQPDEFSSRIARNAQIIFKEEAYLDQVYDPAAGSYYLEVLTDKIAAETWELFQELEKQGGLLKAITGGFVAQLINESAKKKDRSIEQRDRVFVGTNKYPNAEERRADARESPFRTVSLLTSEGEYEIGKSDIVASLAGAFKKGARLGDLVPQLQKRGKQLFRPIEPYRGAQAFEELRRAAEDHDPVPTVFLLPMGDRRIRKARSTFAADFFGCAGYRIEDHIGFERTGVAIEQVKESKPEIVVICSSDEEYKELVGPLCRELKALEKPPIIVLAGDPENDPDRYREAGVDSFITRDSNALKMLRKFHQKLNIIGNEELIS